MAYKTWQAISDYSKEDLAMPAAPLSMAIWIKPTAWAAVFGYIFVLSNSSFTRIIRLAGDTTGTFVAQASDGTITTGTGAALNFNAWNHLCGVFDGSSTQITNVAPYTNGVLGTEGTTDRSWTTGGTTNRIYIGGQNESGVLNGTNSACKVAYAALWNIALSQTDVTNLQTKYPTSVQAANLISYYTLDALPPDDTASNNWDLALNGTDCVVDNTDLPSLSSGVGSILILQD